MLSGQLLDCKYEYYQILLFVFERIFHKTSDMLVHTIILTIDVATGLYYTGTRLAGSIFKILSRLFGNLP